MDKISPGPRYKMDIKYIGRSENKDKGGEPLSQSLFGMIVSSVSSGGSRLLGYKGQEEAKDQIVLVRTNLDDRQVEVLPTGVTQELVYKYIKGNTSIEEAVLVKNLLGLATGEDLSEVDDETLKLASNFLLKTENIEALRDIFQEPHPKLILEAFDTYKLWSMGHEAVLAIIGYKDPIAILRLLGENNELLKLKSGSNVQGWVKMLETLLNNPDLISNLIYMKPEIKTTVLEHSSHPIDILMIMAEKPQLMQLDLEVLMKILDDDKKDSSAIIVLNHISEEEPRFFNLKAHIAKAAIDEWKPGLMRKFLDSIWASDIGQRIRMRQSGLGQPVAEKGLSDELLNLVQEHSLELNDKEKLYANKFLLKTNNKEGLLSILQNPDPLSILGIIIDNPNGGKIDPKVILAISENCIDPPKILDLLCTNPVLLELNTNLLSQIAEFDQSDKPGLTTESVLKFLLKNTYFIKGDQVVLEKILKSINPMRLLNELLSIRFIKLNVKIIDLILERESHVDGLAKLRDNFDVLKLDTDFLVEILKSKNVWSILNILSQERLGKDVKRDVLSLLTEQDLSAVSEKGIDICYAYLLKLKNTDAVKVLLSKNGQNVIIIDKLLSYGHFSEIIENKRNVDFINKFLSSGIFVKILSMPNVQEILYTLSEYPMLYSLDSSVLELMLDPKISSKSLYEAIVKSGLLQETGTLTRVLKIDNPVRVLDALRVASPEQRQEILDSLPQ